MPYSPNARKNLYLIAGSSPERFYFATIDHDKTTWDMSETMTEAEVREKLREESVDEAKIDAMIQAALDNPV